MLPILDSSRIERDTYSLLAKRQNVQCFSGFEPGRFPA